MPRFGLLAALLLILLGVWGGGGVTLRLWIRPGNAWLFCSPVRQVRTAKTTSSSRLSVYFQRICSERKYFHKSLGLTRLKSSIAKSVEKFNCTSEDYPLQRVKNFHFFFLHRESYYFWITYSQLLWAMMDQRCQKCLFYFWKELVTNLHK